MLGLLVVALGLAGCSDRPSSERPTQLSRTPAKRFLKEIVEVPPPASIQQIRAELEVYQPQVKILSPQPEEMLDDTQVEVNLDINDLPLFKDEDLGLGPHLHVILDNQPYQAVYDTSSPLVFEDLEPGTHTLRVFASRPWHESFKNAGAYDQVKFYVFTQTPNNDADLQQPIMTYSRPKGAYGAEPIMLDFYLANTPLHVIAQEEPDDDLHDWQIRGTVNGQSFTFDTWEPIYLTGFEPGLNWLKLELLDEDGDLIDNAFNSTARIIQYQPGGSDSLSQLVRGELSENQLFQIIDPDYEPAPAVDLEQEQEPEDSDSEVEEKASAPEPSAPEPSEPALSEEIQSQEDSQPEPEVNDAAEPEPDLTQPAPVEQEEQTSDEAQAAMPEPDIESDIELDTSAPSEQPETEAESPESEPDQVLQSENSLDESDDSTNNLNEESFNDSKDDSDATEVESSEAELSLNEDAPS
ncbi:MAG: hypothetical protein WBA57_22555 [Elainellaceae cyanobacterium]